jgi:hypothetical protein
LSYLADRYDTTVDAFKDANPFLREERLRVGMILDLPTRDVNQPTVVISPVSGLPGTQVRLSRVDCLQIPPMCSLALGRLGEGYYQQGTVDTDEDGRIDTR